jgi:hypothetical protein
VSTGDPLRNSAQTSARSLIWQAGEKVREFIGGVVELRESYSISSTPSALKPEETLKKP